MNFYVIWAVLLLMQNAAFTMVSRARNSGSDWYHAFAAVGSNGIWLVATFFTFDKVFYAAITEGVTLEVMGASLLYVVCTVTGSVFMGKFLRRYIERGKRQVGHYDEKAEKLAGIETRLNNLEDWAGLLEPFWALKVAAGDATIEPPANLSDEMAENNPSPSPSPTRRCIK